MDGSDLFDLIEEEFDEIERSARIQRRVVRDSNNPFDILNERQFVKRYRLSKDLVRQLCEEMKPFMKQSNKSCDLATETKVLIALSFYGTGSYQRVIGDIVGHSVAQETVSLVLKQVTKCLNLAHFRNKYIIFPKNITQRRKNIIGFNNKFGMPGVLGCIDCTHVAIIRPKLHEERFYCRKQYHSLNVQLICDSNMDIISVDASYGGANHDSFIWSNHPLKPHMEQLANNEAVWLLGDSGYPLRKSMMTPVVDAAPGSPEAHYTDIHVRTRNVIERTIGLLKARFRCLLAHRTLHYEPEVAASMVNACVILHNICNRAKVPVQDLTPEEALDEAQLQPSLTHRPAGSSEGAHSSRGSQNVELQEGIATRQELISQLWQRRGSS